MKLLDLIKKRQSDRKYDVDRKVPRELLEQIVEAARWAPSATNGQPWHFIIVDEPELKAEVASALTSAVVGKMNHFAQEAPALIVIVEESSNLAGRTGSLLLRNHLPHLDIGIAAAHITLAATELGLGSCIMGWVMQKKMRKILGLPKSRSVPLVVAVGYSLEQQKNKKRKSFEEICSWNEY